MSTLRHSLSFPPLQYATAHLLEVDVASGVLRAGVFHVNKREPLEGYVHPRFEQSALMTVEISCNMKVNDKLRFPVVGSFKSHLHSAEDIRNFML